MPDNDFIYKKETSFAELCRKLRYKEENLLTFCSKYNLSSEDLCDVAYLTKKYETDAKTIFGLVKKGHPIDDISAYLEIRESISDYKGSKVSISKIAEFCKTFCDIPELYDSSDEISELLFELHGLTGKAHMNYSINTALKIARTLKTCYIQRVLDELLEDRPESIISLEPERDDYSEESFL